MLKNTATAYGSVAKWIHWLTALCFLVAYVSVYARHWVFADDTPASDISLRLHVTFGLSVIVFSVLRVYWKLTNPTPKLPAQMPKWQIGDSHASHALLHFFIFAMPFTGYFGFGGSVNFGLFTIPTFRNTGMGQWLLEVFNTTWADWEAPMDYFHKEISGALVLWILIVIHAGAALYHHYVQKDDVLKRMLPGRD